MKSDRTAFLGIKYGLLLFGLLFLTIPVLNLLDPELVTFNGDTERMDILTFLTFVLIGSLAVLVFLLFQSKFAIVELGGQTIKIRKGNTTIEANWLDVESVELLQFIFPPLYKLRIRNNKDYFLFATGRKGIYFAGYTKDLSEMGNLIQKKKKELGL